MTLDEKNKFLKSLNNNEFLRLGAPHVAYIREVEYLGKKHFAVHKADGSSVGLAPNKDTAIHTMQSQDMEPVTLH